ncbi:MAG: MliC family protein [Gemmatimonadales bacterium]
MTRRIALVVTSIAIAACTQAPKADQLAADTLKPAAPTTAPAAAPSVAAAFRCSDSLQLFALFRTDSVGKAEVALAVGDERLHLPQLMAASGARYGDSTTIFWNKGDSAAFTRGGKTVACHVEK